MGNVIVQEHHYSALATKDISELAAPLKKYGIESFCYVRYFNDDSASVLINNKNLYQHHFKCGYKIAPDFPFTREELQQNKNRYYIAYEKPEESYSNALNDYKNLFGLDHFIFIPRICAHYTEYYIFAAALNNHGIVNFYLNQMDVLEQFIHDFQNKAGKLITQGDLNKLIIPENMRLQLNGSPSLINQMSDDAVTIKNQPLILHYQGNIIKLSPRELECLQLLKSGYTAKETAQQFGLSYRTVEHHINNIKLKFGLNRKSDVIKAFIHCSPLPYL